MNKKTKLTTIVIGAILTIVLIVLLFIKLGDSKDLVEDPNLPKEYWPRAVFIDETGDGLKTAVNRSDEYKITVPLDWGVGETADFLDGLDIYSEPDSVDTESFGGVLLNIRTIGNLEQAVFDEIEIGGSKVYRAPYGLFEEESGENFETIKTPMKNSGTIAYIFTGNDQYYLVRCTVISNPRYIELLSQCEEQIKTFEMTN